MITPQRARRALLAFLIVVPVYAYVAVEATMTWSRGRAIMARSKLIQVAIIESGIEERKGLLGRTFYAPRIRYAVRTELGSVIQRQVTPLDEAAGKSWAEGIAERYRVGRVVDGYVDTTGMRISYLVPSLGTFIYWTLAAGVALFGALAIVLRRAFKS